LPTLPPSPWKEFLQALDAKMTEACRLPCFGGFAVTLAYGLSRLTFDIDVLDVAPPRAVEVLTREGGKGSPLAIKHKVYLDFVGIANPPYDYESRLRPMYEGAFRHLTRWSWTHTMWPFKVETRQRKDSRTCFTSPSRSPLISMYLRGPIKKNFAITLPVGLKTTTSHSIVGKRQSWKFAPERDRGRSRFSAPREFNADTEVIGIVDLMLRCPRFDLLYREMRDHLVAKSDSLGHCWR
jgi:hypothetical protein